MGISVPILALIVSIANIIVGKIIVGKKRRKISETEGKNIEIWGLILIGIIGLCCIYFVLDIMKLFWLCFLILIYGFHTFMEWKFLKDSKDYVVSLIVLIIGVIYILIVMF